MSSKTKKRKRRIIVIPTTPGRTKLVEIKPKSGRFHPVIKEYVGWNQRAGLLPKPKKAPKGRRSKPAKYRFPRTSGHGMRPYYKDIYGINTYKNVANAPPVSNVVVAGNAILYNVLSNSHGDFKRPNAQTYTKLLAAYATGDIRSYFGNSELFSVGVQQAVSPPPEPTFSIEAYNSALSRLYSMIKGYKTTYVGDDGRKHVRYDDIDLSVDIAEAHQVRHMLASTAKAVLHAKRTFKRMLASNPQDWGNLWLEFTYGWKPLANSIYGTLAKLNQPKRLYYELKSSGSETFTYNNSSQYGTNVGVNKNRASTCSARCRIAARFCVPDSQLTSLAGYTSLNPVHLAWELLPYSFVVDWFIDVGGYLSGLENALVYGNSFLDGYVTETYLNYYTEGLSGVYNYPMPSTRVDVFSTMGNQKDSGKRRTILTSVPFPRFAGFAPNLGSSRLISSAALLGQFLPSLRGKAGPFSKVGDLFHR